jgi:hypothetical protein
VVFRVILILTITLLACGPSPTSASVYVVQPDGSGDFPTIQAAIDAAVDGDTVELTDGTFRGNGNRDIDYLGKAITIRSQSGNADACILECEGSPSHVRRGFIFQSGEGASSTLEDVTIRNGIYDLGAGIRCTASSPRVLRCVIDDCSGDDGGGVYCSGGSVAQFESCIFSSNSAFYDGGGGYSHGSSPTFSGCTFIDNHCQEQGGGLACRYGGNAVLQDCLFSGNWDRGGGGGGLLCDGDTTPTVTDCRFINNTSANATGGFGGGVSLYDGANVVFTRCTFADNTSQGLGGGLLAWGASPRMEECTFSGNAAHIGGGALSLEEGAATLVGCTISGNSGPSGSGVLCRAGGSVELERVIVAYGGWSGEAVRCEDTGTATLSCTDLFGNEGGDWVGSIEDQYGSNGNISADPLFCGPGIEDLTLHANSPCAPDSNPDCGLIGAWPVDCSSTPVERTSWSAIKAMFRR